ncbi:MAG: TauD/TfdA family dioxygenase [Pseudomonadales bacterium]
MGEGVLSVGTEPAHTNIDPHSEMAYWHYFPQYIMFGCERAPGQGGETVIASNERCTLQCRELMAEPVINVGRTALGIKVETPACHVPTLAGDHAFGLIFNRYRS